jgi:hypothetical protein
MKERHLRPAGKQNNVRTTFLEFAAGPGSKRLRKPLGELDIINLPLIGCCPNRAKTRLCAGLLEFDSVK